VRIAYSSAGDSITVRDVLPNDANKPTQPVVLRVPGEQIVAAELDRDGSKVLARCGDGTARFWVPSDYGPVERVLTHAISPIRAAAFSHDGRRVATADADGTVRVWNTDSPGHARRIPVPGHFVTSLGSWHGDAILAETRPWLSDRDMVGVETLSIPMDGGTPTVIRRLLTRMQVSPDRTRFLVRFGRELVVVSCQKSVVPFTIAANIADVAHEQFTPDGSYVLLRTADATLHAWNVSTAEREWKRRGVAEATCSPNGTRVLARGVDGTARLFVTATGDGVWEERDVLYAAFTGAALGTVTHVRLDLHDGTVVLRPAESSDPVIRFAGDDTSPDRHASVWITTQGWAAHLPARGGVLSVCPVERPDNRLVLTTEAEWVDVLDGANIVLVRSRNGDLWAWSTEHWKTLAPGEGRLIATDVARAETAPNRSRVVIQFNDGMLALLDRGLTTVERTLFAASGWSWNPSATSIAGWLDAPAEPNETDAPPSVDLRVAHLDAPGEPLVLGSVIDWRSPVTSEAHPLRAGDVRWLDESHVAATITSTGNERVDTLAFWNVHLPERAGGEPSTVPPRVFSKGGGGVRQAVFGQGDRYWLHYDSLDPRWACEALTLYRNGQVTGQRIDAVALRRPIDAQLRCVFDDGSRFAAAHSYESFFWIVVERLEAPRTSTVVASGSGTVERIAFAADGQALDVELSGGRTARVRIDGPPAFVGDHTTGRIALPYLQPDGSTVAALMSDGSALVWNAELGAMPLRLGVPGRRIGFVVREYDAPRPDIDVRAPHVTATLDDGTVVRWEVDNSGEVRQLQPEQTPGAGAGVAENVAAREPSASSTSPWSQTQTSFDKRHAIGFGEHGTVLVTCDGSAAPFPLESAAEVVDRIQFSADGQWVVAAVEEPEDRYALGVRIWNVDDPTASRLLPNVDLIGLQGNFVHFRRRQTGATEVVACSGADEPLVIPRDAVQIGDHTVMYLGPDRPRRGIHLVPLDRLHESMVLLPPWSRVEGARHRGDVVLGRLANGELCAWDLRWKSIAARIRAATTATLSPEQRRRLLGDAR
jgi:WD40 repeat protein